MQLNIIRREYRRTTLIIVFLVSILAGLGLAKIGYTPSLFVLITALVTALIKRKKGIILLGGLFVIGLQLGLLRGSSFLAQVQDYDAIYKTNVVLTGRVEDDLKYSKQNQLEFHISDVRVGQKELPGRVRIRAFIATGVIRGDRVEVSGKIYPGFGNRQGSISFAQVESLSRSASPIESLRREYFTGVYNTIPDPQASLGLGFLVGLRALLPEQLLDQLTITGLTHIVAVSGYNLTVLIRITRRIGMKFSRFTALFLSLIFMATFVLITGGAPSIIRASIVAVMALTAWYFGRTVNPLILLLSSAVISALISPLYLWLDIGWWLSFLAFYGVLILGPLLKERFIKRDLNMFGQILLETTSAQIMALPFIMVIFGELSLISLFANALILPMVPLAMLLTFVAGTAGVLVPASAGWVAWPAKFLLEFMTTLVEIMSKIPGALIEVEILWQYALFFYALIIFLSFLLSRKQKLHSENFI